MATRFHNDSFGTDTGKTCEKQGFTQVRRRNPRRSWARLLLLAATVSAVAVPTAGCTMARGLSKGLTQHECLDDFMIGYRNRAWSARAWLCRKERFRNHRALADFEAGFRQGYEDIAAGGSGCVPAVCPRAYWGWQYQSSDGQQRMNAWFEGYPLGVQAAEEDGIGNWNHVATAFAGPAPCQNCPTGAMLAVPPKPDGEGAFYDSGEMETLPLPAPGYPDQLPVPLIHPITAPTSELED